MRLQDEMPVREATVHGDVTILDFGQNFAGIVEIDPSFLKNETITIRHGEILNADGSLYTANLRKAKATIVYHCLLYTSDAADDLLCVGLGGSRLIKKKNTKKKKKKMDSRKRGLQNK